MTDQELVGLCVQPLLAWHRENRRPLPWRRNRTPYTVWVAEIMLQQTRIEAAAPYYERFLAAAPTVTALAELPEDRLLKLWEGLGYYSRARNMHRAARIITENYGGELPRTAGELEKLPGIGAYTAGAIASIAWGEPSPAVDGNVLRVLSRLLASPADIMDTKTRAAMTALLAAVYPTGEDAGLLTEGIMELGQTLCLPGDGPNCGACPLAALCRAHQTGAEASYPVKSPKPPRRVEQKTVLFLHAGEKIALRKRDSAGLLAGLWEFPNAEGTLSPAEAAALAESWGCGPLDCAPGRSAKHVFTHVEWHMTSLHLNCESEGPGFAWLTLDEIRGQAALPTAFKKFLADL